MHTTVIKLNALPDPVWPPAQDHHLSFIPSPAFIFCFICGVIIGGMGLKLGSARVHEFINR